MNTPDSVSRSSGSLHFEVSGFGGLEVACWPLVPKFAGSKPVEAVGFLRVNKKILSTSGGMDVCLL
jgi:hypothetical protein